MRSNFSLPQKRQLPSGTSLPSSNNYRSSVMAEQKLTGRDTKGKMKTSQGVARLIEFLEMSEYPHAVSTRILQSPNAKDVFGIFQHLVRQLDPQFTIDRPDIRNEELCLNTLRNLGYKVPLSKQYLATPGARHAWPSVLAALDWLREEAVSVKSNIEHDFAYKVDDSQDMTQEPIGKLLHQMALAVFCEHLSTAEPFGLDLENYRSRIKQVMLCPTSEDEQLLAAHLALLERECTNYDSLDSTEQDLRNRKIQLEQETEKEAQDITKLGTEVQELQSSCEKSTKQEAELLRKKEVVEKKLMSARAQVKEQEDAGYGHLRGEMLMLQDRYSTRLKSKNGLAKEVDEMELACSRSEGQIAPALDSYNRLVSSIKAPKFVSIAKRCGLQIRTYGPGFDLPTTLPRIIKEVTGCLDQFQAAVVATRKQVMDHRELTLAEKRAITDLNAPSARTRSKELQEEKEKWTELIASEDSEIEASTNESLRLQDQLSAELNQINAAWASENARLEELEATLLNESKRRVQLKDEFEALDVQLRTIFQSLTQLANLWENERKIEEVRNEALRAEVQKALSECTSKVHLAVSEWKAFEETLSEDL